MKPKVFIGSSSERLDIAYTVKADLDSVAEVKVWTQGFFELTNSVLDNLISDLNESDFGIFIFWPEDIVKIREEEYLSARDNVVFEFGLFIGGLGKTRTFFILPHDHKNLRLPSDLSGITPATFDSNRIDETLPPACSKIKQNIRRLGIRKSRFERPDIIQINKPAILCASSTQYAQFEFDQDVTAIQSAFPEPEQTTIEYDLTSLNLRKYLTRKQGRFDIVHINAKVEMWSSELVLREKLGSKKRTNLDTLDAKDFSKLVERSKTSLVVLTAWEALGLAVKLSRITNVTSVHDKWTGSEGLKKFLDWEKLFYELLAEEKPLSVAFEEAKLATDASMYLIMNKDVVFTK